MACLRRECGMSEGRRMWHVRGGGVACLRGVCGMSEGRAVWHV